jgi:hypothetical protein
LAETWRGHLSKIPLDGSSNGGQKPRELTTDRDGAGGGNQWRLREGKGREEGAAAYIRRGLGLLGWNGLGAQPRERGGERRERRAHARTGSAQPAGEKKIKEFSLSEKKQKNPINFNKAQINFKKPENDK